MEFKLRVLCLFIFGVVNSVKPHELQDLVDTTPEEFPYQVVVSATMKCPGILITENYVITPALCVEKASNVTVYLGFRQWPFYSNNNDKDTQIYDSTNIYIHENYARVNDRNYIYNIALVKLPQSVKQGNTVRPGKLISKKESHLIKEGFANMSGWMYEGTSHNIQMKTVELQNQETCRDFFGPQFLGSQEICAKSPSATNLYIGNAIQLNGKIIGYLVKKYDCIVTTPDCKKIEVILNLIPHLDWISEKVNISTAELTGKSQEWDSDVMLKKMDDLMQLAKETKTKYEQDMASINKNITNIISGLEQQLREIKTDINYCRNLEDQQATKYRDEINSIKTEITGTNAEQLAQINILSEQIRSMNDSINDIVNYINSPIIS